MNHSPATKDAQDTSATHAFTVEHATNPLDDATREAALENPKFGSHFTDHMAIVSYTAARGWHDAKICPRRPLMLDPAASVFHYGQEIFEGMKAYRTQHGDIVTFRPRENARRFRDSARRMAMPELPETLFMQSLESLMACDHAWVPQGRGQSLYIRPFMIATEALLGVRPAREYQFIVIATPAGNYFDKACVDIWVTEHFARAAMGGTGAAKCGGNYAAGLMAQREAAEQGCDQVLFLDAATRQYVEELGGMNVVFVRDDNTLVTPRLTGTILPGITRDAITTIASYLNLAVEETQIAIDDIFEGAQSGRYREAFACGTAAVVSPIGRLKRRDHIVSFGDGESPGPVTSSILENLTDIQYGRKPDPYGWVETLFRA
ncbi:putative branched-chain-amino-acid aminotransferase [Acetobacteraceae bacterium EV16G]|uniref:Probable branched-chain-amino-acid aminotransferase n=1 Tax=Sorlinia euscelidii TaxID=3081148 RepID=A0ABU7U0N1_9PROT